MNIREFVELCDVENNFCFLPRDGLTFCNCYAKVVLASQGIFIPNMVANDLYDWFSNNKSRWSMKYGPGIAIAIAKHSPHGHIAVEVDGSTWTAAGAKNHKFCTLKETFGNLSPTIFYGIP